MSRYYELSSKVAEADGISKASGIDVDEAGVGDDETGGDDEANVHEAGVIKIPRFNATDVNQTTGGDVSSGDDADIDKAG